MDNGNYCDPDIKPKAMAPWTYMRMHFLLHIYKCEVLIGLTLKEDDQVVHKPKWFKWEGNSFI
jgi:hypothetical protein